MYLLIASFIVIFFTIQGTAQEPRFAWKRIGPDGGNITCFLECDSALLVGTPGGMFRSTNNGASWQSIEAGLPTFPFTVGNFANVQGTIFAALGYSRTDGESRDVGNMLYASQNQGLSWYPVFGGPSNSINGERFTHISFLDAVDSLLLLGVVEKQFDTGPDRPMWWRSFDKGKSWSKMRFSIVYGDKAPRRSNSLVRFGKSLLFLPREFADIFRSDDNGATWFGTTFASQIYASAIIPRGTDAHPSFTRVGNSLFWAADTTLFCTRDTGRTWQRIVIPIPRVIARSLSPFPSFITSANITDIRGINDTLILSIVPRYEDENSLARIRSGFRNESRGAIMRSVDAAKTWDVRPCTIPFSAPLRVFPTHTGLFCIAADNSHSATFLQNGLWFSRDGGTSWLSANNGIAGYFPREFLKLGNGQFLAMTDVGRLFRLENSFFQRVYPLLAREESFNPGRMYTLDTTLYGLPPFASKMISSIDGGRTWTQLQDNAMIPSQAMKVQFNGRLVAVGYVYGRQPNWVRSTDTGRTWHVLTALAARSAQTFDSFVADEQTNTMYIQLNPFNDSLLMSSDGGTTWILSISREAFNKARSLRVGNILLRERSSPSFIGWEGGSRPALYSRDNGVSFQESSLGLPSTAQIRHLALLGRNLYAATSRGVYVADISTSVSQHPAFTPPSLSVRCTPNPAQDAVLLTFVLPAVSTIRYEVLDMLGRVFFSSPEQERSAGEQSIVVSTEQFPSGVYVVRVLTRSALGLRTETARLLVVR